MGDMEKCVLTCDNTDEAERRWNVVRPLTHHLTSPGRGLAMEATRLKHRQPRTMPAIPDRVAQRAAVAYVIDDAGCWISTYSVASHGYAQIGWWEDRKSRMTTAHRAAWTHWRKSQIPPGMTVDHLCKSRRCVNPDHLRLLTNFENARRTSGRDWPLGQCVNGHPNSDLKWSGGKARCATCRRSPRAGSTALVDEATR